MALIEVPPPLALPDRVHTCCVRVEHEPRTDLFGAGRHCARMALGRLAPSLAPLEVRRGEAGEPIWPAGFVGSISHTADLAWAAVASSSAAAGLGIDIERIRSAQQASRVAAIILRPREEGLDVEGLGAEARVSLVLSIKESVFKCLYPLVRRRFYFDALEVNVVDLSAGIFRSTLVTALAPAFPAGFVLEGRCAVTAPHVAAAVML